MNLFSIRFWFALLPSPVRSNSFWILLTMFLVFVLIGIGGKVIARYKRQDFVLSHIARRLGRPFTPTGIVGLILLFFEYERVSFLSSRFWYLFLLAWFIYSANKFIQFVYRELPQEYRELERKMKLEKYLPRK
jgi:hypothetical protein